MQLGIGHGTRQIELLTYQLERQGWGYSGSTLSNGRGRMTAVVVTHAVGNIDAWLQGGANRKEVFAKFCSSYRIFRHPDDANRVSIVCENVDLAKMKAAMNTAETNAVKARDTVIDPIEIYKEVDGGK
jgi:hypothetical protein